MCYKSTLVYMQDMNMRLSEEKKTGKDGEMF